MQKLHQGDIVWLNFDPQAGHEGGRLAVVCPITSHSHRFPTHVALDERTKTQGLILCEQCKSLDLDARDAKFIEKAPDDIVQEAVDIVHSLLD